MLLHVCTTDLVCFIGEEDSVEDLSGIVLNGINFNKVRRVATDTSTVNEEERCKFFFYEHVRLLHLSCDTFFLQQL